MLSTLAGNDRVAPNPELHYCGSGDVENDWLLPLGTVSAPWGLWANMGTGSDFAYGTPNRDVLRSRSCSGFPASCPADNAYDALCGYGGDDQLDGDADDTFPAFEDLNGGVGGDTCYGGDFSTASDWAHTSCESITGAISTGTDFIPCGATPPNPWNW